MSPFLVRLLAVTADLMAIELHYLRLLGLGLALVLAADAAAHKLARR